MGGLLTYLFIGVVVSCAFILVDKFTFKEIRKREQNLVPFMMLIVAVFWPFVVIIATLAGIAFGSYKGLAVLYKVLK